MFSFAQPRPRRRPSLTPMIDVVFLLLIFFMLASQFGRSGVLPMAGGAARGGIWQGPPRLIEVAPGMVALNGAALPLGELAGAVAPLTDTQDDLIVLRGRDGASLQRLIEVVEALRAAGFTHLVLVE